MFGAWRVLQRVWVSGAMCLRHKEVCRRRTRKHILAEMIRLRRATREQQSDQKLRTVKLLNNLSGIQRAY